MSSPLQWPATAFSEAVTINPKRALPKTGIVPFLDMASLPLNGASVKVRQARPVASGGAKFQAGDTLFARITPCAENGKLGFVSQISGGQAAQGSTEFIVMGPKDGVTSPEYVRWLAGWDHVRNHAIGLMEGTSGRQRVPVWAFDEIEVPVPPLEEQRRIAEVLRSVDETITTNEAVAAQARRTYQAALTELVGSGLDHWKTVRLGQIATFVNGRGFKPHEWGDKGFPIIRIQNLNGGSDFNYYGGDFNPKILVRPGDLLFAWSGSRGTSFGPHIWRGPEGVLNYHTWKVVPAAPEDRDYLYFALRHLTKKIEDEAHGASALVHMQKAYVVDYEIQLPPLEERNTIAAILIDLGSGEPRRSGLSRGTGRKGPPHVRPALRSCAGVRMSEYRLAERPALDVLDGLGYQPLHPDAALAMRVEENRVILKPVLIEAVRAINGIGEADAEAVYNDLATLSDNEEWQKKLRGGYSRRITGEKQDHAIALIDFKHPANNRFHVVRQFRVAAQRSRIADIVLFVNGIPLVVIEAKSPLKATAKAEEAFEQIKQYERDIERLRFSDTHG